MPDLPTPVSVHWDYYDQVHHHDAVYGREAMNRLCASAKAAGVQSLNFRIEGAGMWWVPSVGYDCFERYEPDRCVDFADFSRLPVVSVNHAARQRVAELFRQTYYEVGDPLATACDAAREAGIQLNIYLCPLDQYWPGVPGTLVERHPERCIASRDGTLRVPVPSLAYPENREWLLDRYRSVFDRAFADVIVYPNSHAWYSYPLDVPDDWFGFESPAVDDYRKKTSIDVRRDSFDIDDYYRHYGTYWTMFLRELAQMQQSRGRRLTVGMDMGPWQVYLPWGAGRPRCTWRWANDWPTWVSWGNVDLCVGHQVNMWEYDLWPANGLPYMPGERDRPPYLFAEELFGAPAERNFSLWAFLSLHADRAQHELRLARQAMTQVSYDGLMIREAAEFEFKIGWSALNVLE